MMVYYTKLRAKEAAGRDGAMTRSVQGCPLVLNLMFRWVFNTTQSCSELVVIGAESGVRLSFLFYIETIVCLYDSSNYQVTSADTFRPCRDK